mmetsp:Transcript_25682/g.22797  ORF Transcript_25682/g.22797 Transcript_25682/m.22797 type:complete len:105 (-) Transcript_25682:405-719(-)
MQVPSESIDQDSFIVSDKSGYSTPKFNKSGTINTALTSTALTFYCSQNNNRDKPSAMGIKSENEEDKAFDSRDSSDLDRFDEKTSTPLSLPSEECIFSPSVKKA